jgi:hypothetical protein
MVAAVLGEQAEGLAPWVETELLECTPAIPLLGGLTFTWALAETTPHAAANAGLDAPIAAVTITAASAVALQMAGNLEDSVRIGFSSRRSGEKTQAALNETWHWQRSMPTKTDGILSTLQKQYGDVPSR